MRALAAALLVGLAVCALAACGGSADDAVTTPALETIELQGPSSTVQVRVEVADSTDERRRGLSGRAELEADRGMLFVNDSDVTVGYHMRDTLIPLSLAFIGADGVILDIVDMEPCTSEPCPVYSPPGAYRLGLEVNRGAFERWEIDVGALVVRPEGL